MTLTDPPSATCRLWRGAHLATMLPGRPWGWIEHGAMITKGDTLTWVGPESALPAGLPIEHEHRWAGGIVTPGLIDPHTHLIYAGDRSSEFDMRLHGASYADIARAGGGIQATVRATRSASDRDLLAATLHRARALQAEGVTTVEIKSGYGLTAEDEARSLRIARAVGAALPLTVRTSALGAHALPPEFEGRPDDYIDALCRWLPAWHEEGLVDAVDGFCEHIAFRAEQIDRLFRVARSLGLPVKLHAEQLSLSGGAEMASRHEALSCDHLEWLDEAGIQAMARSGTVAVLLPGAFYFLRETRLPPIDALRAAGVPIALATDHNPGTSPTLSPLLMMNMACTLFRFTPDEALAGFTRHAACALGLQQRLGCLAPGLQADFAHWAIDHPAELACHFGQRPVCQIVRRGEELPA